MRSLPVLGAAALLAVLPAVAHAQSTTQDVVVKESTTVVVKEAPKPSPLTFTPYGFFVLNAFFNDSIGNRIYPFPTACTGGASCEGNVLFDVRQSRLGSRLSFNDTAGWTKATLSALVEVDFQGGYSGAVPTSTIGFYSPVIRLRKAYADSAWGTESKLTLRIGQDDIVTSLLRPVSLAYIANPLFQFAGTLNGRAPMIAVRYDLNPKDGLTVSAVAAAVGPQENTACEPPSTGTPSVPSCLVSPGAAVDLGSGNRSRVPAFEGRVGLGWKQSGKNLAILSGWAGWQKNRFVSPATDTNVDVNSYIYGADLTLNLWVFQLLGGISQGHGYDVPGTLGASQGIALTVTRATPTSPFAITGTNAVKAKNGWFQVSARPIEALQIYGGWGGTQSPFDAYTGSVFGTSATTRAATRLQNFMWAAGVIGHAGKNWRFSAEYGRATSYFLSGLNYTQGQLSLNSQLVF
jgi:hypothetical protein